MRPDGSDRRPLTRTREFHEAGVRFSPDGKKMLYYRIPRTEAVDNNTYGTYDLVIADADGANAVDYGRDFPWASWGPDGKQIACLDRRGIRIVDVASRQEVRQAARARASSSSSSGRRTARRSRARRTASGRSGTSAGSTPETGTITAVSETERYNCTPDWMPDSRGHPLLPGHRPARPAGYAELWMAGADGKAKRMLYAEDGRHLYGGCCLARRQVPALHPERGRPRPGGQLADPHGDHPDVGHAHGRRRRATLARRPIPAPGAGRCSTSRWGWEPHWTYAEIPGGRRHQLNADTIGSMRSSSPQGPTKRLIMTLLRNDRTLPRTLLRALLPDERLSCARKPAAPASSAPDPELAKRGRIEVTAKLVEIPEGAIFKRELYDYATVLKYQVLESIAARSTGETIYVGHYNPFKPRSEAADQRVHGRRRQSQVVPRRPGAPHGPGGVRSTITSWEGSSTSTSGRHRPDLLGRLDEPGQRLTGRQADPSRTALTMVFTTYLFVFYFLPLVLLVLLRPAGLGRGLGASDGRTCLVLNAFLLLASYVFYGWWNPWFILLMLGDHRGELRLRAAHRPAGRRPAAAVLGRDDAPSSSAWARSGSSSTSCSSRRT